MKLFRILPSIRNCNTIRFTSPIAKQITIICCLSHTFLSYSRIPHMLHTCNYWLICTHDRFHFVDIFRKKRASLNSWRFLLLLLVANANNYYFLISTCVVLQPKKVIECFLCVLLSLLTCFSNAKRNKWRSIIAGELYTCFVITIERAFIFIVVCAKLKMVNSPPKFGWV